MKYPVYQGFKFNIGDVVIHKLADKPPAELDGVELPWMSSRQVRYFVTGRHYDECPGGVQLHYICTACNLGTGDVTLRLQINEIELVAAPLPRQDQDDGKPQDGA